MLHRMVSIVVGALLLLAMFPPILAAQTGEDSIDAEAQRAQRNRKEQNRPIRLGTSGGSIRDRTLFPDFIACCSGTLGALVEKNGKLHVLSNNHVIARLNRGKRGERIIQPGFLDQSPICQVPADDETVGRLRAWKRIKFGGQKRNRVDAAIAEVEPGAVDPSGKIIRIGIPGTTPVEAAIGMEVKKAGRTTGLTRGIVFSVDLNATVNYEQDCDDTKIRQARFVDQIAIAGFNGDFSRGGDSGAVVYRNESSCPAPVGLLFAGSDTLSVANPIKKVLKQLSKRRPRGDVELVGCTSQAAESDDLESEPEIEATSQGLSQELMADPEIRFARRVLARQKERLLQSRDVFAVGVGLATSGAAEPVVQIFADRDRPESWLDLPTRIEGVRTEIVPTGPFVASCRAAGDSIAGLVEHP